jgi:hypothetical protein
MSVIVMVSICTASVFTRETLLTTAGNTTLALACLQIGFLIGAAIAVR